MNPSPREPKKKYALQVNFPKVDEEEGGDGERTQRRPPNHRRMMMMEPSSRSLIGSTVVFPITDEDVDRSIDYGLENLSKQ